MIRFKQFITEGENSLNISIIKRINNDLYRSVKELQGFSDTTEMVKAVIDILAEYDVTIVADDNRKFSGRIIASKGKQSFELAPTSTVNDREEYIPFPKVKLNLSWDESKSQYILKDANIS